MSDEEAEVEVTAPKLSKEEASMAAKESEATQVSLKADVKGFAFLEAAVRRRKAEVLNARKAAEGVAVRDEDVALVSAQLDMDTKAAKEFLQTHEGNVQKAFAAAIDMHATRCK